MYCKEHLPEDGYNRWPKHVGCYTVYNKINYISVYAIVGCIYNALQSSLSVALLYTVSLSVAVLYTVSLSVAVLYTIIFSVAVLYTVSLSVAVLYTVSLSVAVLYTVSLLVAVFYTVSLFAALPGMNISVVSLNLFVGTLVKYTQ
jgi:hypothetical protein